MDWTQYDERSQVINQVYSEVFDEIVVNKKSLLCYWPLGDLSEGEWFELQQLFNDKNFELEIHKKENEYFESDGLNKIVSKKWKEFVLFLLEALLEDIAMNDQIDQIATLTNETGSIVLFRMEQNGGFLTEFWSSSSPEKENFVKRNRIVAGMSEATIVIESAEKGGSLITANLANDYNRDVFAVPGRTTDKYSQGCNELIKTQRAQLITSAADLIYSLNWQLEEEKPKTIQKQLFVSLDAEEQKIYDFLLQNGKQLLDIIALECECPIFRVSSTLINMELKGVVRPLPGKLFEAI